MIVTCQECSTSFQLDDSRIPASGARVRCSRCKHAFFLPSPSASQSEAIHAVAEEAIQTASGSAPGAARDLPRTSPPRAPAATRSEPEEEDWQFSEEIRVAGDEPDEVEADRASLAHPDPDSFDLTGDFGRGFDPDSLGADELPSPPADAPTPSARSIRPKPLAAAPPAPAVVSAPPGETRTGASQEETGFGSIDDFSSLIEDDDVSIELASGPATAPGRSRPSAGRTGGVSASSGTSDELGDPESWDIVGGDGGPQARPTKGILARPVAAPKKSRAGQRSLDLFEDTELPAAHEDPDATSLIPPWLGSVGHLVGWCVAGVSVLLVGGLLLRAEWAGMIQTTQRVSSGMLVAETTRTGWLETSRAGLLLVVEGELRNTAAQPSVVVPVQLSLLDRDGARLGDGTILAGRPLTEGELRESRPEELEAHRARAASGWLATPLAPGEVRPFTAIVRADELPNDARRLLLELGSRAGH